MVQSISSMDEFQAKVKKDETGKLIVIDFYADWCGPCRMIAPRITKMDEEFPNVDFYKVNVDEVEEVTLECGVNAMPTFIMYKKKEQVEFIQGANEKAIREAIERHTK